MARPQRAGASGGHAKSNTYCLEPIGVPELLAHRDELTPDSAVTKPARCRALTEFSRENRNKLGYFRIHRLGRQGDAAVANVA